MTLQYDRTLPTGLPLAEYANTTLNLLGEGEKIKGILNTLTRDGGLKEMLEIGYAAKVIECDFSGSSGNTSVGLACTAAPSGATGVLVWQNDLGSAGSMVILKDAGSVAFAEGDTITSNTNTFPITSGTLVLSPGGTDNKYSGEVQVGAEAGSGGAVYDALIAVADGMTALRADASNLFQGG